MPFEDESIKRIAASRRRHCWMPVFAGWQILSDCCPGL